MTFFLATNVLRRKIKLKSSNLVWKMEMLASS
ncbi:hypothetical protein NC651_018449 [Populus alba x Populus x berolinensis]|nr:hypothetical protein NC651_018449 [Populus alba x Populus x berolinensis]